MGYVATDDPVEKFVAELHEAAGTKDLANRLARLLIDADPFAALNGGIMALALWQSDPGISKENAMELALDLGKRVAEQIDEDWEQLIKTRKKMEAGDL